MNTVEITTEIRSRLDTLADLQAKWETTHDAWGELASHEEEESFGDAEYTQIEMYAQRVDDLEDSMDVEVFMLRHLYCLLGAMDVVPYDIQEGFREAEIDIPYGWQSF